MEKIKQALERARKDQGSGEPRPVSDVALSQAQKSTQAVHPISYQQTRVFQTAQDVLVRNLLVVGAGQFPAAETAYKILRTQVEQRLAARGWNAIAVTSPSAGAGKTITAINLSMALAKEIHRTVLLVDLDFRNPSVHRRFECEIQHGLVDYLIDDVPLNGILINPGIERLVVLPAGSQAVPNSSELLASPKMVKLKSRYPSRLIVFDLPPLLSSDDALAFSPYVDTTLLVVAEGRTTKEEIKRAIEILGDTSLIGTVLNRSSEVQSSYYY